MARSLFSTRRHLVGLSAALLIAFALTLAGCGSSSSPSGSTDSDPLSGSLTVSAATSLKAAFTDIAAAFEKAHPGVSISINFGASSTLAQQIIDGAPVDVFASADEANMMKVSDAGFVSDTPTIFATNSLEIIVRGGNPSGIASLADLADPGLIYITCAPAVPIGKYGAQSLQRAGVTVTPASLEPDVKGIVAKISSGEADAGIVYATDVLAAGDSATGVPIPDQFNVTATYPQAVLTGSSNTAAATAWMAFVSGTDGQSILQKYGFGAP
jgi:molybdate transport system substrate-binding protein